MPARKRKSAKWGYMSPIEPGNVFDNDDARYDDVRLRILQTLALRADEAGGAKDLPNVAGATWSVEVKDHLPDGQACVHVFKDGEQCGFVARTGDELDAVFATLSEAQIAAIEASALLRKGHPLDHPLTILRR